MKITVLSITILILCVVCAIVRNNVKIDTFETKPNKQKCTIRTSDGQVVTIPDPWYQNSANPDQCFAPPLQKCCNQVVEGCMQSFTNQTKAQVQNWIKRCI